MDEEAEGVFDKVQHAMSLLKSHGLPFGISTCYTRKNLDDVTSEKFFDMLVEWCIICMVLPLYAGWK